MSLNPNLVGYPNTINILIYCICPNYRTYPYKCTVQQIPLFFRLRSVYLFLLLYKGICYGYSFELHGLVNLLMQFKRVPITYAFIKKIRKKKTVRKHHLMSPSLIFSCFIFSVFLARLYEVQGELLSPRSSAFAFAFPFPSHCVKVFQMLISQQSLLTEASNLELRYLGGSSEIPRE